MLSVFLVEEEEVRMEVVCCSWLLPNAAWQVVCHYLHREDLLAARLVCIAWREDLGAFIPTATIIPSKLLQLRAQESASTHTSSSDSSVKRSTNAHDFLQGSAAQQVRVAAAAAVGWGQQPELQNAGEGHAARSILVTTPPNTDSLEPEADVLAAAEVQQQHQSITHDFQEEVQLLLGAFPHCELMHVDASSPAEQQLVPAVVNAIARQRSSSSGGGSTSGPACYAPGAAAEQCLFADDGTGSECSPELVQFGQPSTGNSSSSCVPSVKKMNRPQLCLDALQRCYHCQARQEYPSKPGAGRDVFQLLTQLPAQLSPAGLSTLVSLQLDVFPDSPAQWGALQQLPWLRELVLPFFKPAVPHEHLPALAQLTHLEALTLSVQGSITSWRTNCAAFAALGQLSNLQRLNLHAFHCPGTHLASALLCMTGLSELRLSGRVVLEPLAGLSTLTKLQVLELTQDVQCSFLCDVVRQLPGVTQLAVGRVTLPPLQLAAAAELEGPAAAWNPVQHAAAGMAWQQAPPVAAAVPGAAIPAHAAAAAAAGGGGGGEGVPDQAVAIPAGANPAAAGGGGGGGGGGVPAAAAAAAANEAPGNADAAAVVVAADGGGGAAVAAAAGGEGGVGEVMLEDVGAIVDGLIGNLQDGAVPVHLQRIIERFESIIQLDLTRRSATSPWGWPVAGLALLSELGLVQQQQQGACRQYTGSARSSSSSSGGVAGGAGAGCGCSSFELALLRPADVVRLAELPCQLLGCSHLGLRLRDQLLAFASVCPVKLAPGQLSCLGAAFKNLASLNLCGKFAMDGDVFVELCQGLSHTQGRTATAARHGATAVKWSSNGVGVPQALQHPAATASSISSRTSAASNHWEDHPAAAAAGGVSDDAVWYSAGQATAGLACLWLDCHFVAVTAEHISAALQHLPTLKVLSLRHRGGGKLPVPLSALPKSLNTLAAKKVLLYHEKRSRVLCYTTQQTQPHLQQQQHQQYCEVVVPAVITSPNFSRDSISTVGSAGVLATALSAADIPGLTGSSPDDLSPRSDRSSSSSDNSDNATAGQTASVADNNLSVQATYGASVGKAASCCACASAVFPHLTGLFLKNCIVGNETLQLLLGGGTAAVACQPAAPGTRSSSSTGFAANHGMGQANRCQLVRLSVTGDNPTHGEMCEGWPTWVAAIKQLTTLQVLDLTVPDSLGSSLPPKLLKALANLPRLAHLHLTTSSTPSQLLGLTQLRGLRTLSLNYTGPPVLPQELLGQLQAGLGPNCKIQLWEMVVTQHPESFRNELGGAANAAGGAGEGVPGRYSRRDRVKGVLMWGAMHAASIWIGWKAGSRIRRYRMERKANKKQQQQQQCNDS